MPNHGRPRRAVLRAVLAVALTGCASVAAGGTNGVAGRARAQDGVSDRLYFGLAIPGGGMVSDSAWRAFLRDVFTPAFPEGFTVFRAEGQWLDPRGDIVREPTMVVEVSHSRGVPADSVFERVATEYRVRFRQDAVLRVTGAVRTWLYTRN